MATSSRKITEIEALNLTREETKRFISDANLMIILRGVSGSGKSTLVEHFKRELETDKVCSADNFFMRRGVYEYDRSFIKQAHEACQRNAETYCEQGHSVVIVDNTHIKKWETTAYTSLANKHGYMVVMVVPSGHYNTPIEVLARRNKHGVAPEIISQKLKDFDKCEPSYFAWFLNRRSTLKLQQIKQAMLERLKKTGCLRPNHPSEPSIVHKTSLFCGRLDQVEEPKRNSIIQKMTHHIGDVESMDVTSIVVTKRTICAGVKLNKIARSVYYNDGRNDDIHKDKEGYKKLPKGHAAHITLALAEGMKAYQARHDMILSKLCEMNSAVQQTFEDTKIVFYPQEELAVITLDEPVSFVAMFAGGYSSGA